MRLPVLTVAVLAVLTLLAGCGRGQASVPDGAELVHVTVAADEVRLDRTSVPAGDVYVVLDTPGSSVAFVGGQGGDPGPLTDADLRRLRVGDEQGLTISGFADVGCSPQQRAEDRGRLGPCGNVFKVRLAAGSFAFVLGDAEPGVPPRSVAILEAVR